MKQRTVRKLVSWLLVFCMTLLLLPGAALAAEEAPVEEVPLGEEAATDLAELPEASQEPTAAAELLTETGGTASGRDWVYTPLIKETNSVVLDPDPEAPAPWGVVPDDSQLYYHEQELAAFIHFGVNTYTGSEWGSGSEDPAVFNPTAMQTQERADAVAEEWVKAFQAGGFQRLILVGKHHDGFCLWPSEYT